MLYLLMLSILAHANIHLFLTILCSDTKYIVNRFIISCDGGDSTSNCTILVQFGCDGGDSTSNCTILVQFGCDSGGSTSKRRTPTGVPQVIAIVGFAGEDSARTVSPFCSWYIL